MNFGTALKEIRMHFKLSQATLAKRARLSQTAISQFENGEKNPSRESITTICAALKIPEQVVYLLAMEGVHVPASRKEIYDHLYPHIKALALELLNSSDKTKNMSHRRTKL